MLTISQKESAVTLEQLATEFPNAPTWCAKLLTEFPDAPYWIVADCCNGQMIEKNARKFIAMRRSVFGGTRGR